METLLYFVSVATFHSRISYGSGTFGFIENTAATIRADTGEIGEKKGKMSLRVFYMRARWK